MKYIAVIDADEKPVSCEFIGCNGNVAPYLIGATTNIKPLEQQPCEDCISRQVVKEMLTEEWTKYMPMELDVNLAFVLDKISELPSVTPQPKTGHWITDVYMYGRDRHTCSNCGKGQEYTTAFCSWCGADMRGEEE